MKRLLALDIDGTILNSQEKMNSLDIETIQKVQEAGWEVVICTGRPVHAIPKEVVLSYDYASGYNGSIVMDMKTKEKIIDIPLDKNVVYPILEGLLKFKTPFSIQTGNGQVLFNSHEQYVDTVDIGDDFKYHIKAFSSRVEIMEDLDKYTIYKVNLFMPDSHKEKEDVLAYLKQFEEIKVVSGGFNVYEFNSSKTSKGKAIRKLAEYLNIHSTMACGDSENDLSMIECADIGIAMGNAETKILEAADYVTLHVDECGVSYAINKVLNNEWK